jgi:hypothetical protein
MSNRREFLGSIAALAALAGAPNAAKTEGLLAASSSEIPNLGPTDGLPPDLSTVEATGKAEVYKLLGFAPMSGEDPLALWARLRNTTEWLVGPLSPDGSLGQVFVADHKDIFAFRFAPVPTAWMKDYSPDKSTRVRYCGEHFNSWCSDVTNWWSEVGPRSPDNSYARLVFRAPDGGPEVTYEWAQTEKNEVVCRITQSAPCDLMLQAYLPWDTGPTKFAVLYSDGPEKHSLQGRSWVPGTRDGMRWVLAFSQPADETSYRAKAPTFWSFPPEDKSVARCKWNGLFREVKKLYLCGRQGQSYEPLEKATSAWLESGRIDVLLDRNRERYLRTRPDATGWLKDAPALINDPLQWSEVYTPSRRSSYITSSRSWAGENNSAPDYMWDSFFNALLVSQEDPRKARATIRTVTRWQNSQGMFAQVGQQMDYPEQLDFPVNWGRTSYPVGSLLSSKIWLRDPDRSFLKELYPRLLKAHRWWFADRGDGQPWRDGNRNGLLELGCNYPQEIPYEDLLQNSYFEASDDSPQWKGVTRYNLQTQTLEQDTVERNCLYAMDASMLSWMAKQLGRAQEAAQLSAEHETMRARINAMLWDPRRACYLNRRWEPREGDWFFPQIASDVFLALPSRVPGSEQEAGLRALFNDPKKFAGQRIIPSISRDDPAFPDQFYWRGNVWPPINWLVYQGLKMYEWDKEAAALARSSMEMCMRPWREKNYYIETLRSTTGEANGGVHYPWGALMGLIGIEELIDINPWHGLRFGNLYPVETASIERYPVAGALYDVALSASSLEVRRDDSFQFGSDAAIELRHVEFDGATVRYEIRCNRPVQLRVGNASPRAIAPGLTRCQEPWRT